MSKVSLTLNLFPATQCLLIAFSLIYLCQEPGILAILLLIAAIYILPLLAFHFHRRIFGQSPARSFLDRPEYVPWWGEYQIQSVLNNVKIFEVLLKLSPGLYAQWLRLWGSSIGKNVTFTPSIEIIDRGALVIGDHAIFGHQAQLSGHLISPTSEGVELYIAPITIGARAFIGAKSGIGPGVEVEPRAMVKFAKTLLPYTIVKAQ